MVAIFAKMKIFDILKDLISRRFLKFFWTKSGKSLEIVEMGITWRVVGQHCLEESPATYGHGKPIAQGVNCSGFE